MLFNHSKAQQSSNGNTMSDSLYIYTADWRLFTVLLLMTWIGVEITFEIHGSSNQCCSRFCTDYYSNCKGLHSPATTSACYLEHARFIWSRKNKCIVTVISKCAHGCVPHFKVECHVVCNITLRCAIYCITKSNIQWCSVNNTTK